MLERFAFVIGERENLIPVFALLANRAAENKRAARHAAADNHLTRRRFAVDVIDDLHFAVAGLFRAPGQFCAVELARQVKEFVAGECRALISRASRLVAPLEEDQRAAFDFHFDFGRVAGRKRIF